MSEPQNDVVNLLRGFAKKFASAPDRMTTADGQGGITASSAQPKKDPGEGDLKQDLPADGTMRTSDALAGAPDRMTTADGQGGITASQAQPKKDSGEGDLKQDLPADGTTRKSARVEAIRTAILGRNPALAPAAPAAAAVASAEKSAGSEAGPIELSKDLLAKIASNILSTEEGINFVYEMQEKAAGAQAARDELLSALQAAEYHDGIEQVKSAALNDVFSKAAAIHGELSQILTEDDADLILKQAALHQAALLEFDDDMLKMAYAAGMDDAALLEAADEAAPEGAEGAPEGAEGAEGGELPMSGEEGLSEEEVLALLQQLIESGEISEEEVMQALQEAEGAGAAGADAGAGDEAAAAAAAPQA